MKEDVPLLFLDEEEKWRRQSGIDRLTQQVYAAVVDFMYHHHVDSVLTAQRYLKEIEEKYATRKKAEVKS